MEEKNEICSVTCRRKKSLCFYFIFFCGENWFSVVCLFLWSNKKRKDETRKQCNDPTCQTKFFLLGVWWGEQFCRKTENFLKRILEKQWKKTVRVSEYETETKLYIRWEREFDYLQKFFLLCFIFFLNFRKWI